MTDYVVSSGVVFRTNLRSTDTATALDDRETLNISDGGHEFVSSGGLASGTTIESGGVLIVSSGGQTMGGSVAPGGTLELVAGGVASSMIISSGGAVDDAGTQTTIASQPRVREPRRALLQDAQSDAGDHERPQDLDQFEDQGGAPGGGGASGLGNEASRST